MTDTEVTDALVFPHDEGLPGISDGDETWDSAGFLMMLAMAADGASFIRSKSEMAFTGHDGGNDQVDVTAGVAFLDLSGETVNVQSTRGGSSPPAYDTALPTLPSIAVILPTNETNLSATASSLNDFWLAYDTDGTGPGSAGSVYIRHGTGLSSPGHPSVKIGQANPDNSGADVLNNRFGSPTLGQPTLDRGFVDGAGVTHTGEIADSADVFSGSHSDLSNVTASQHHSKYTDAEARSAVEGTTDVADLVGGLGSANQVPQTDGAAVTWVTLPHDDLTSVGASDHHAKYTDSEARTAAESDGAKTTWGAAPDFSARYDATDDEWVLRDEVGNDDVAGVDKAGNLALQGTLTESTTV